MRKADSALVNPSLEEGAHGDARSVKSRVTVNLTPKAANALAAIEERTEDSKTDTINRALVVYEYLERIMSEGGAVLVRERDSDEAERVRFL